MTRAEYCARIEEAIGAFDFQGQFVGYAGFGNGHINDTFLVEFQLEDSSIKYILQHMNVDIFKNPVQVMENIGLVSRHLRDTVTNQQGNVNREVLNIILTKGQNNLYLDTIGSYWRAYQYIENTICLDQPEQLVDFYESGLAFGRFQYLLSDFDADLLSEIIPNFHHTPKRFVAFQEAVEKDIYNRVKDVKPEIEFLQQREADMKVIMDLYEQGELPLRVTHNDTKLNNVLLDKDTRKGICVIDLDTVMPGFSVNDFGDSIRFGANTALEDEQDLSKVSLDLQRFEVYTQGFLAGCNGKLTEKEMELLPMGAKLMTLECGMRFLTDYLQGDTYFNIHREGHNLDRCRTQLKLVEDMECKWEQMMSIIHKFIIST